MDDFAGSCFRCGNPGHWAESPACPWLVKAATKAEHQARIDYYRDRWIAGQITAWQKSEYIKHENRLQYDGKAPASLA